MVQHRIARFRIGPHALALIAVLFAAPLAVAAWWGAPLGEEAYLAFAQGRNVAAGRAPTAGLGAVGLRSPPAVLLWAMLEGWGAPVQPAAAALSALGWGATALGVWGVGRALGRPIAGATAAGLVAVLPPFASTLGTEGAWALALFWCALWLGARGAWRGQGIALAGMLLAHHDWLLVAWALAMLGAAWRAQRRFPRGATALVLLAVSARLLAAMALSPAPLALPRFSADGWRDAGALFAESEWTWFALPLIALGAADLGGWTVWGALAGGALAAAGDGALGGPCLATACALLAGLGIERGVRWVEARVPAWRRATGGGVAGRVTLALVALAPLWAAELQALEARAQARPLARYAAEREAARWVAAQSGPEATVMGTARVGYLAQRPLLLWDGAAWEGRALSRLIDALDASPPDYCISAHTTGWDQLARTGWFEERYELLERYEAACDPWSPTLVWGYQRSGFDRGAVRPAHALLPEGVRLVGSRHWPERIAPGDMVYVTLYLEATGAVGHAFETRVRAYSPTDGASWAYENRMAPRSIPVDWWRPGQVIAERYTLATAAEIPVGAYPLDLSLGEAGPAAVLGYVSVPWEGTAAGATPLEATFADQIRLVGFEAPAHGSAGTPLEVTLYWEAIRPPEDNYIVFVHLVGPGGGVVCDGDGPPMGGRYPSMGWHPGDVIPDRHALVPGADAPAGRYTIRVGLYTWPEVVRLPVRDGMGNAPPDRAIVLSEVEVR